MHSFSSQDRKLFHLLEESLQGLKVPKRVLLALSGGPDSMALFLALTKQGWGVDWAVAHVDHGWRKESAAEANELEALCNRQGVPFYVKALTPTPNEEFCRQERLRFFQEICVQKGYQAVLMAHQKNDQAETVLKRLFEGASLFRIAGIRSSVELEGLMVIRPWLDVPKEELMDFLNRHEMAYFDDHTNRDPQYLRARMRESLLPELNHIFGKNIVPALVHVGREAQECRDYMECVVGSRHKPLLESVLGSWLLDAGVHSFELRFLLKQWKSTEKLSRATIDDLIQHYVAGTGSAVYPVEEGQVIVDQGRIFHVKSPLQSKSWKIESSKGLASSIGWKSVFQGSARFLVPEGDIQIGTMDEVLDQKAKEKYLKRLSSAGVPQFLRHSVPVARDGKGEIYSPFYEGKGKLHPDAVSSISMLYA